MASATGIPAGIPDNNELLHDEVPEATEEEPLLGRLGDASQQPSRPLYANLYLGTGIIAQAGIVLLVALTWANVFLTPLIFFSPHPLLNTSGLLLLTQSILLLQPTHLPAQKRSGTYAHFGINVLALSLLASGLVIIEINKFSHNGTHFESPHAILGLITYISLLLQSAVGVAQFFFPAVFGGVDKAKAVYKYHRWAGYVILGLMLGTVGAATQTTYNLTTLHIEWKAVLVASILVVLGVVPRIHKQKLGF
ncbi:hypothetical protein F5884DRAFT_658712 [Xylogone sp. PMI_703]|nr:hypothetical protein F5884DRAFT_658712 [Xylogone sp. PMI_703]